jgi:hypothetical protein
MEPPGDIPPVSVQQRHRPVSGAGLQAGIGSPLSRGCQPWYNGGRRSVLVGIIETLTAGFDLVRKKLWLILLPIVLNVGLWVAPRLSVADLMRKELTMAMAQVPADAQLPPGLREQFELYEQLAQVAEVANLGDLVGTGYVGVPLTPIAATTSFFGWAPPVVQVQGLPSLLGLVIGLLLLGLPIGVLYAAPIAAQVRDGEADWRRIVCGLPRYCVRLVGAWLLTLAVLMCIGLPMALTLASLALFSQGLALMLVGLAGFALIWVMIYLAFVQQAILLGQDGVLQAVGHSINVVRISFWPTVGLLLLVNVIALGLGGIWQRLMVSAPAALLAITANAYVGTGLTAALFIFYRERLHAWQQIVGQLRSHTR